jgi:hypothetical protein
MPAKDRRVVIDRSAAATIGDGALVIGTTPFIGEGTSTHPRSIRCSSLRRISYDGLLVRCAGSGT